MQDTLGQTQRNHIHRDGSPIIFIGIGAMGFENQP
jgi:hypothetical protein